MGNSSLWLIRTVKKAYNVLFQVMRHIYILFFGVLFLLPSYSQERIASFNWLDEAVVTFSDDTNESVMYLTDKSDTTFFQCNSSETFWIQSEFERPVIVSSYTLISSFDESLAPANWTLAYSDNAVDWVDVHEKAVSFAGCNAIVNIPTELGEEGHKYYRLTFDNGNRPWSIAELQFFGREEQLKNDITDNGGVLTGQYDGLVDSGEGLENVIDNQRNKFCQTGTKSFWLEYESAEPMVLEKYGFMTAYTSGRMPRTWEILGSVDGENYELLDRQVNRNLFDAPYAAHYYYIDSLASQLTPNWARCADLTYKALIDEWWMDYSKGGKYFIQTNGEEPHMGDNYWWNAHGLDILVDGYQRTGDPAYIEKIRELDEFVLAKGNGSYWNTFYDDMEWMALACLRVSDIEGMAEYEDKAIQLWNWIKGGWTSVNGGGIMWATGSPNSKNACSNGPAMILACRLYERTKEESYLNFAKNIYAWMNKNLYDAQTGYVWDGYGNHNVGNVYTYNIGTWLGGCLELYRITGETQYMDRAVKSASAVVDNQDKFSPYGVLYNGENSGDGGLFKCIFMRYLSQLIMYGDLDEELRDHYINYMRNNGLVLWNAGTMKPEMIVSKRFYERPDGKVQDSSVQMCGVMIFELLAELEREGFLPPKDALISKNAKKAYKYFRLEMQANNGDSASELAEWQLFGRTGEIETPQKTETMHLPFPVRMLNAGKGQLELVATTGTDFAYAIFDLRGKLLDTASVQGSVLLNMPQSGCYVVKIMKDHLTFSKQVIIQ